MDSLKEALKKHYTHKGNRLIFSNGMNLNQLALAMWERLGFEGVDSSVLSKVLNGKRLFKLKQLEIFCDLLSLERGHRVRLNEVLIEELSIRYGFKEDFFVERSATFLDLVDYTLQRIQVSRNIDTPRFSLEWVGGVIDRVEEEVKYVANEKRYERLLQILGGLYTEKIFFLQVGMPKKSTYNPIAKATKRLISIGREINNRGFIGQALGDMGDKLYIDGKLVEARQMLDKAFEVNDFSKVGYLRTMLLTHAYLGNSSEFIGVSKEFTKTMEDYNVSEQCQGWEGIARGEAVLGRRKESGKALQKGYKIYDQFSKDEKLVPLLRKIQLIRTEIETGLLDKQSSEKNYLEKRGIEGMALAYKYGYVRHADMIKSLLLKIL